jgi:hypothetical protein
MVYKFVANNINLDLLIVDLNSNSNVIHDIKVIAKFLEDRDNIKKNTILI